MALARALLLRTIGSAALLGAAASRADAQQAREARLTVSATVIASATRIAHAEVNALSSSVTGPLEREVLTLVTATSSGESVLSLVSRISGVTVDVIGADGSATPIGMLGVPVARTTGGREVSAPVRLRLRAANLELLDRAVLAPVSLLVSSATR
jgi:hypothetical protein